MSDFNELAGRFGIDTESVSGITTPLYNKSNYYNYVLGDYQGLLSRFSTQYLDKEKKKCKRDAPGATLGYGTLRIIIFKDPELQLIGNNLAIPETEPYGRMVFTQYIPIEEIHQWRNVRLLSDLSYNDIPEASIIQGKKGQEEVHLANLTFFLGAPIKFSISNTTKNEDARFLTDLELLDHATLTKETLDKRKQIIGTLEASLNAYLERLKKERKKDADVPDSDAEDPDSFISDNIPGIGDFK